MNTTSTSNSTIMPSKCPYCSTNIVATYHQGRCPYVHAIEYYKDGTVKRVEFITASDYVWQAPRPMLPTFTTTFTNDDTQN